MNFKFIFTAIIFTVYSSNIIAHKNFYKKGNDVFTNAKIISGNALGNSKYCKIKVNHNIEIFTPSDISEYQLGDGRHYFSMRLPQSNPAKFFFFELLLDGACKLYSLTDNYGISYYLQKGDDSLFAISSRIIFGERVFSQSALIEYLNADIKISSMIANTKYTKLSLKNLIYQYNNYSPRWLAISYGIMGSMTNAHLKKTDKFSILDKTGISDISGAGYRVGGFFSYPFKYEGWLIRGALAFSQTNFSGKKQNNNYFQSISLTNSSLDIPITISYMYNHLLRIKPYLFAGINAKYSIQKKSTLYEYFFINTKDIAITKTNGINLTSDFQPGILLGIGSNFMVNTKRYIFFELSYTPSVRLGNNSPFNSTEFNISAGINL